MRLPRTNRPVSDPADEVATIQVTILYEDLESGIRAKAMMECVQSASALPGKLKLGLWRFDWLREHSMRSQALSAVQNSTLVVVSSSGTGSLSIEMENWLGDWTLGREDQISALIVLIPQEGDNRLQHQLLHERLEHVAQQKQIGFFCECFEQPFAAEEFYLRSRPDFWKANANSRKSDPMQPRLVAPAGRTACRP